MKTHSRKWPGDNLKTQNGRPRNSRPCKPATGDQCGKSGGPTRTARKAMTILRGPHDWPSYLVRGSKTLAWLWGATAVREMKTLLKTRSAKRSTTKKDKAHGS